MNEISFTIANVERETGLSKDLLRMWERRYGFPAPTRDANGDRIYPADQVDRLRRIKRLTTETIAQMGSDPSAAQRLRDLYARQQALELQMRNLRDSS